MHKSNAYAREDAKLSASLPWVEKYRPKSISNISLNSNIKNQIEKMILDRDVRNIILEGPSGVGKTSTVRCIAREIYGKYYKSKVLEINASDDRGIKLQNPIEIFNRKYVYIEDQDIPNIPNFKLVILDEADDMTDKANHNITKFIETNNPNIRFAFTCNSKRNISPAIQSRCYILNYPKLDNKFVVKRLKEICELEGVSNKKKSHKDGVNAIAEQADGDLRIAINTMQMVYDRYKKIDITNVYDMYDKPHPQQSRDIIDACIELDMLKANDLMNQMIKKGFSVTDVGVGLIVALRQSVCEDIDTDAKIKLLRAVSHTLYNVSHGLELSSVQARGCIADMLEAVSG